MRERVICKRDCHISKVVALSSAVLAGSLIVIAMGPEGLNCGKLFVCIGCSCALILRAVAYGDVGIGIWSAAHGLQGFLVNGLAVIENLGQ